MDQETRDMLLETADRFFTEKCGREVVNGVEKGVWPADLWKEIEEMGLPLIAWFIYVMIQMRPVLGHFAREMLQHPGDVFSLLRFYAYLAAAAFAFLRIRIDCFLAVHREPARVGQYFS